MICTGAEVDLRVGGRYEIANCLPDGSVIRIEGEFEVIESPRKLVYTWRGGKAVTHSERVTVAFNARNGATEVVVVHERILNAADRISHERGWVDCIVGVRGYSKEKC
ncbi:MAG: SRPBCC domain-containing protein [Burkholderiales bacterium]